uniref:Putative steroid C25 dehydrogenase-like gamma-subunit n=1 Tax=Sterolibacterium denitrificans TaxID=157592 RepID=H9NNA3_9PROT|nr:putative steroid C25 dehydrogenase-like gamma-subunit [Sterolibacterium denitrificans]
MKKTVTLIAAPTAIQPGGYIAKAYEDRTVPGLGQAELEIEAKGQGWQITLSWACPAPVKSIARETDKFLDACALLVPATENAQWITMGSKEDPVEGVLWKADREKPWRMQAEGLGTMIRQEAPVDWTVAAEHANGRWTVRFEIGAWPVLSQYKQLGFAIWLGERQDRAGLKSVSPGWLAAV